MWGYVGAQAAAIAPIALAVAVVAALGVALWAFFTKTEVGRQLWDKLVAGLKALAAIPQVRELHVGVPAGTEQRDVVDASFDVSELMLFDTLADQKAYQDHPAHQAFVAACAPLWRKVVVYDSVPA